MKATDLNLWVLARHMGSAQRATNQVEAVSAPHLRRCIKAGLVAVEGAKRGGPPGELVLTETGRATLAAYVLRTTKAVA